MDVFPFTARFLQFGYLPFVAGTGRLPAWRIVVHLQR